MARPAVFRVVAASVIVAAFVVIDVVIKRLAEVWLPGAPCGSGGLQLCPQSHDISATS